MKCVVNIEAGSFTLVKMTIRVFLTRNILENQHLCFIYQHLKGTHMALLRENNDFKDSKGNNFNNSKIRAECKGSSGQQEGNDVAWGIIEHPERFGWF